MDSWDEEGGLENVTSGWLAAAQSRFVMDPVNRRNMYVVQLFEFGFWIVKDE